MRRIASLLTQHCTDLGNAQRMVALHGDRLIHVTGKGWMYWTGTHWERDTVGHAQEAAKDTAIQLRAQACGFAEHCDDGERNEAKALLKWAAQSESLARIRAMVALAESEPKLSRSIDQLDANPYLFNCANGTVNLRTGELRPHDRADLMTVCAPASLLPHTDLPTISTWATFLERIQPDADTRLYLQKLAGLSLIGEQREHVVPFLYGGGQNGKGTMLHAFETTFGAYVCTVPVDLVLQRQNTPHASQRATLMGKRIAIVDELSQNREFDTSALKSLSGGDRIAAQYMRQDWFDFAPSHTLWLQGNDKPKLPGSDFGVWRRLRLVPFLEKIPDHEKDNDLKAKLDAERDIIMRWAVDGAVAYMRDGLGIAREVAEATDQYRDDSDIIGQMVRDTCNVHTLAWVSKAAFRNVLEAWYKAEGRKFPPSNITLKADFAKRGIIEHRPHRLSPWGWQGIEINSEWASLQYPSNSSNRSYND